MTNVTVSYTFPADQEAVHNAAHQIILSTMQAGAASNGEGSWQNKKALEYHVNKAMIHVCSLWGQQDIEGVEKEPPHLKHLFNALTRLAMAWAVHKKQPIAPLVEEIPE